MAQIKLRGLKLLEGGAQVASLHPNGENLPAAGVCSLLARSKINITFLAYVARDERVGCATVLCTEDSLGRASASLVEARGGLSGRVDLHDDVSTLSVFPHEQRPHVTGRLLETFAGNEITLLGLASSPSAVSSVVFSANTKATINAFFNAFEFPAYLVPADWHAAYEGKEELLRKTIASYEEKVIRIYGLVQQPGLDLWNLELPTSGLKNLGAVLADLGRQGAKMPFVVALPSAEDRLIFSFCFPRTQTTAIRDAFSRHLGTAVVSHHPRTAVLFIHGPHFGDRYGIAHTLTTALKNAGITLLAMGCTVSSISVVISDEELAKAVQTLDATFQRSSGE